MLFGFVVCRHSLGLEWQYSRTRLSRLRDNRFYTLPFRPNRVGGRENLQSRVDPISFLRGDCARSLLLFLCSVMESFFGVPVSAAPVTPWSMGMLMPWDMGLPDAAIHASNVAEAAASLLSRHQAVPAHDASSAGTGGEERDEASLPTNQLRGQRANQSSKKPKEFDRGERQRGTLR